ncbi:MAG TPA: hypothetical protein PLT66_01290 [Bacillota bacterium]|nr:hypothetical protein [Bacillota bacterium]
MQTSSAKMDEGIRYSKAITKIRSARSTILVVAVLSVINFILINAGSETYFVFSLSSTYLLASLGAYYAEMQTIGIIANILIIGLFVLFWFLSKKRPKFIIGALVMWVLDFIFMLSAALLLYEEGLADSLLELAFRAVVLVSLILGTVGAFTLGKYTPEQINEFTSSTSDPSNGTLYVDSQVSDAQEEEKSGDESESDTDADAGDAGDNGDADGNS